MNQRFWVPRVPAVGQEKWANGPAGREGRLLHRLARLALLGLCLGSTLAWGASGCVQPQTRLQKEEEGTPDNDKDLDVKTIGTVTEVANAMPTVVSGVGLVINLEGTGCPTPAGSYRTMLEKELHTHKVERTRELLSSDDTAMVLVSAVIPPGAHKDDPLDLDVTLPPGSKATSLQGGYLVECFLYNYDTTRNLNPEYDGANKTLLGHRLVSARGPLLVGLGEKEADVKLRRGRIWGGGTSLIDRPFFLTLNTDQQFARIANAVAERLNQTFRDDSRRRRLMLLGQVSGRIGERFQRAGNPGSGNTAKAMNREVVYVRVPWEYRLNPARYLRVARLVPLQDAPEIHTRYRRQLAGRLLQPKLTMSAALRLEALGEESIPDLKPGLKSDNVLVRFSSAEALAYLGCPAGGEELARLVEQQDKLRAYCLTALSSLNEAVCRIKLAELLTSPSAETRYGAFRALHLMDERDPELHGEYLNESFWVHRLVPQSTPLIHVATSRRPEIVLFGNEPRLVPPFTLVAGEFTLTAAANDDKCTVGRFPLEHGPIQRRQCPLTLQEVLHTLADLGGTYPDVSALIAQAGRYQYTSCPVLVEKLPVAPTVEELALNAENPEYWAPAAETAEPVSRSEDESAPAAGARR